MILRILPQPEELIYLEQQKHLWTGAALPRLPWPPERQSWPLRDEGFKHICQWAIITVRESRTAVANLMAPLLLICSPLQDSS